MKLNTHKLNVQNLQSFCIQIIFSLKSHISKHILILPGTVSVGKCESKRTIKCKSAHLARSCKSDQFISEFTNMKLLKHLSKWTSWVFISYSRSSQTFYSQGPVEWTGNYWGPPVTKWWQVELEFSISNCQCNFLLILLWQMLNTLP